MSDISFGFPWYVQPLFVVLDLPFGLGLLAIATLIAGIPTFIVTALLGRPLIDALRRRAARQTAYEDAPQSHQVKTGTPTMGGLLFALAPLVALLLAPSRTTLALAVLVYACMAIGAVDDVAGIRRGKNSGLRASTKFALTAVAAVVFLFVAGPQPTVFVGIGTVPAWLWYGLSVCVVLATTHAVNLTDGLDGLAGGTVLPPLLVLGCAARFAANSTFGVAIFAAATAGACSVSCSTTGIRRACSWATPARSRSAPRWPGSRSSQVRNCSFCSSAASSRPKL